MPKTKVESLKELNKISNAEKFGSDYKKRFINGFKILTRSRHSYQVWYDLMAIFAIGIANPILEKTKLFPDVWKNREDEYLKTINKYNEYERKIIVQMYSLLVFELERNQDQDLLGQIYMELGIANKNAGQFFTPYNLCKLMAEITVDKKHMKSAVKERGFAMVNDCAVGGGATLIAVIEQCKNIFKNLNFQNHVMFVGQDVDVLCCRMCYIQLSLLGVAGYIKHANTLTDPSFRVTKENAYQFWFTPVWFTPVWTYRRLFHGLDITMSNVKPIEARKTDEKGKDDKTPVKSK